jgi:outer membrane protein OmpA-like peptidoglycan-associated protein/citrate lyase gamma subunit
MKPRSNSPHVVLLTLVVIFTAATSAFTQDGKLHLHVNPKQAYLWVDDRAISEASKHPSLKLSAGEHKVELANYGYKPITRTVMIAAGQTTALDVSLEKVGETVSGPFGAIAIKRADRDAVLLNGKTPDFFVGHGDEFNTDFLWWKQELVVPPGTYQVTVQRGTKDIWSGQVSVAGNQRVIVDVPKGVSRSEPWHRGLKLASVPRFTAGVASATVALARPSAEISATNSQLYCGETSQLKWTSSDAPQVEISPAGTVAASGEQTVQPNQTTTYKLAATGPGGTASSDVTINVDNAIDVDLSLSPAEIHYKRVGDEVAEHVSATLNWSAMNASNVSIDGLGAVDPSGSNTFKVSPQKSDPGSIDETVTYTLHATNDCGGAETRTVALHIVGTIEPGALAMRSVYFPTDLPTNLKSDGGLLLSEQEELKTVAEEFKKYLAYKSDARLILAGHADRRGPYSYNHLLSQRRAELVKRFLVQQGVPESSIDVQAFGKKDNLTREQVQHLLEQSPDLSAQTLETVTKRIGNIVLAYNRRVDLTLSSTGQESAREYPFNAEDFAALAERDPKKGPASVQLAAEKEHIGN